MPDFWDQFRTDLSPADTTALRQSRTLAAPPEPPPAAPGWMAAAPQAAGFAATLGGPSMAGLAGAGTEAIAQVLGGLGEAQQLGAFPGHGLEGLRSYAAGSPAEALGRIARTGGQQAAYAALPAMRLANPLARFAGPAVLPSAEQALARGAGFVAQPLRTLMRAGGRQVRATLAAAEAAGKRFFIPGSDGLIAQLPSAADRAYYTKALAEAGGEWTPTLLHELRQGADALAQRVYADLKRGLPWSKIRATEPAEAIDAYKRSELARTLLTTEVPGYAAAQVPVAKAARFQAALGSPAARALGRATQYGATGAGAIAGYHAGQWAGGFGGAAAARALMDPHLWSGAAQLFENPVLARLALQTGLRTAGAAYSP